MILGCPKCRTCFRIDDEKVREAGVKVRCSRCAHVFYARPSDALPEPEPEQAVAETRRVDPSALVALVAETTPHTEEAASTGSPMLFPTDELAWSDAAGSDSASSPTDEWADASFDSSSLDLESSALFADLSASSQKHPEVEDLSKLLANGDQDLFAELDAATSPPDPLESVAPSKGPTLTSSGALSGDFSEELRGPSVDLPLDPPLSDSFLDPGEVGPSTDLELAKALEEDFFAPSAAPTSQLPSAQTTRDLLEDESYDFSPNVSLVRVLDSDDYTRIPSELRLETTSSRKPSLGRWPTWLGLVVGLTGSALFVPGWAPAPFDSVAPWVADLLHPAARPRLANAIPDVRSEHATAFPYQLDTRTVVVVRGEAVHTGPEDLEGVQATVLMLDGDREVARASAPLGGMPDPLQLERGDWPKTARAVALSPGGRLPFLVVFENPGPNAHRLRFRVEFEASGSASP